MKKGKMRKNIKKYFSRVVKTVLIVVVGIFLVSQNLQLKKELSNISINLENLEQKSIEQQDAEPTASPVPATVNVPKTSSNSMSEEEFNSKAQIFIDEAEKRGADPQAVGYLLNCAKQRLVYGKTNACPTVKNNNDDLKDRIDDIEDRLWACSHLGQDSPLCKY